MQRNLSPTGAFFAPRELNACILHTPGQVGDA